MYNNICLALTYPQQCTIYSIYSYTVYFVCLPIYSRVVLSGKVTVNNYYLVSCIPQPNPNIFITKTEQILLKQINHLNMNCKFRNRVVPNILIQNNQ